MLALIACLNPWVIDGDSIRCRGPGGYVGEVRLLGIDAPDFVSSRPCRGHFGDHVCNDRGERSAKGALIRAKMTLGPIRLEGVGRDRYGRLLAVAWAGKTNLNCWQLDHHAARYIAVRQWWADPCRLFPQIKKRAEPKPRPNLTGLSGNPHGTGTYC